MQDSDLMERMKKRGKKKNVKTSIELAENNDIE